MHLAIAERDRYLLMSIEVECIGGDETRELLQRFMREFKPGQIKTYHREGGDRPVAERERDRSRAFRRSQCGAGHGRWRTRRSVRRIAGGTAKLGTAPGRATVPGQPQGALVGARRFRLRREGQGRRNRRSAHADRGPVAGSGNRRRARQPSCHADVGRAGPPLHGRQRRGQRHRRQRPVCKPPALRDLARQGRMVGDRQRVDEWHSRRVGDERARPQRTKRGKLERADGDRSGPRRAHRPVRRSPAASRRSTRGSCCKTAGDVATPATPMAPRVQAPTTPATPIVAARPRSSGLALAVRMASGERTIALPVEPLPFRIGRSRNQGLVIDWAHEDVSGHHVDIVEMDESGAKVVVHGDNGVTVAGVNASAGIAIPVATRGRRCTSAARAATSRNAR